MPLWSPEEIELMRKTALRLQAGVNHGLRQAICQLWTRFRDGDEPNARGAKFELETLGRLEPTVLAEVQLEVPVDASKPTGAKVDFFLPSKSLRVELMSRQDVIARPVQAPAEPCSPQSRKFLNEEYNASIAHDVSGSQLERLLDAVTQKAHEKEFPKVDGAVWILTDTRETDWLHHYHPRLTQEEHLERLGQAFLQLLRESHAPGWCLVQADWVRLAFLHRNNSDQDELVVFPRTTEERDESAALASVLRLPLRAIAGPIAAQK